jgi:hypothetical protein
VNPLNGESLVRDLLNYVEHGELNACTTCFLDSVSRIQLRGFAIRLLGWLAMQHRCGSSRSLSLNPQSTASQAAIILSSNFEEIRSVFSVEIGKLDVTLDFGDGVSSAEREMLRQLAADGYRPPLHR